MNITKLRKEYEKRFPIPNTTEWSPLRRKYVPLNYLSTSIVHTHFADVYQLGFNVWLAAHGMYNPIGFLAYDDLNDSEEFTREKPVDINPEHMQVAPVFVRAYDA
jgi:hypothetical protein